MDVIDATSKDNQAKADKDLEEPVAHLPIEAAISPPKTQVSETQRYNQLEEAPSGKVASWMRTWLPIILNALILFVIVGHAFYFQMQWDAMKAALKETRISRELENAAFVGIKSAKLDAPLHQGQWQKISIIIMDSGRSPAFNLNVKHDWAITASEPSDLTPRPADQPTRKGTVTPAGDTAIHFWIPNLTTQDVDDITNFRKFIYVYGKIEYDDIFGKHHWTTFCRMNHPTTQDMDVCANGNDSDYQYKKPN